VKDECMKLNPNFVLCIMYSDSHSKSLDTGSFHLDEYYFGSKARFVLQF
jgi:hypothetical protein